MGSKGGEAGVPRVHSLLNLNSNSLLILKPKGEFGLRKRKGGQSTDQLSGSPRVFSKGILVIGAPGSIAGSQLRAASHRWQCVHSRWLPLK